MLVFISERARACAPLRARYDDRVCMRVCLYGVAVDRSSKDKKENAEIMEKRMRASRWG